MSPESDGHNPPPNLEDLFYMTMVNAPGGVPIVTAVIAEFTPQEIAAASFASTNEAGPQALNDSLEESNEVPAEPSEEIVDDVGNENQTDTSATTDERLLDQIKTEQKRLTRVQNIIAYPVGSLVCQIVGVTAIKITQEIQDMVNAPDEAFHAAELAVIIGSVLGIDRIVKHTRPVRAHWAAKRLLKTNS